MEKNGMKEAAYGPNQEGAARGLLSPEKRKYVSHDPYNHTKN
jgi:hypothetical protein